MILCQQSTGEKGKFVQIVTRVTE